GDLSRPLGRVHGRTSRGINQRDGTAGRRVWYRFSDRQIRSEAHYYATLNYIHYNPVKHGLVPEAVLWAASSVHWYLDQMGDERLVEMWRSYPIDRYGAGWDD